MEALVIGASRGIGLEFVRQYLASDIYQRVYGTYRQPSADLLTLQTRYPGRLQLIHVDVTQEAQITAAIATLKAQTSRLDEVIYCVGLLHHQTLQPEKSLRHIQSENLLTYFQVNAVGAVLWAKHLLPFLRHPEPAIFAAISAKVGSIEDNHLGGWYGYRASKAALNMFLKNIAIEWSRVAPNIIVAALHPGTTDTDLSEPFQKNVPPEKLFSPTRTVSQLRQVMANLHPQDTGKFFNWDGESLPW
ncbi:cell-cell signaling protein [Picosynechococcus sp. PCC 7003]|uniref:SDR family NAD(P)-dependent oxidoreductase n=1 Tax=Picosynechococcus sp. PCC 7003 TaxID=374981 RepID=UPI0008104FF1|nr:SDR family NAD(P)-dependent oxidoreductase [Picosynechococcus sp. PCC 7003]ANV83259.1 cell-cell signaling protein [Picosynechococcus sp. PCC 7003]